MQNPNYLKAMLGEGVLFKESIELSLESYTYGDYVESIVDQRSTRILHFSKRELGNLED